MAESDAFTGTWNYNFDASQLVTAPRGWVQKIVVTPEWINVQEEIVHPDGTTAMVSVQAKFDSTEYPVRGSAIADSIAYTRDGDKHFWYRQEIRGHCFSQKLRW